MLFVCNKIDHVYEEVCLNQGEEGTIEIYEDGEAVYKVDGREDAKLLNKRKATFEGLQKLGLVSDSETDVSSSNFLAVSARRSKESRTQDSTDQSKYYDQQYDNFRRVLNSKLDKILVNHILGMVRSTNTVVCRFAEGTLSARSAKLSSDLHVYEILKSSGEAERDAYTKCIDFMSKESQAIESAVLEAFGVAQPKIIEKAKAMTSRDFDADTTKLPVPTAFVLTIAEMAFRVIHREVTSTIGMLKKKYVEEFSFVTTVVIAGSDTFLCSIFLSLFHRDDSDFESMLQSDERDETMEAAVGLFLLIPESVLLAMKEVFPDDPLNGNLLIKLTGVALGLVKLNEKWKESIAKQFLSGLDIKALAPAILKHFARKLEERHASFVQSHTKMIELRDAKSKRSKEDNLVLRTEFTPRIAKLLLRLSALQCTFEKGEPQQGERLANGLHSTVSTCSNWGGQECQDKLVAKTSHCLPETAWTNVAKSFYVLR